MLLSDAVLGTLKWGTAKDSNCHFAVEDADWATSDKPVVLGNDGCVRVFDTELRTCHSVLNVLEMEGGWREGRGEPRFQGPLKMGLHLLLLGARCENIKFSLPLSPGRAGVPASSGPATG